MVKTVGATVVGFVLAVVALPSASALTFVTLSGRLLDGAGNPVTYGVGSGGAAVGPCVELSNPGIGASSFAVVDSAGNYSLQFPAGAATLKVTDTLTKWAQCWGSSASLPEFAFSTSISLVSDVTLDLSLPVTHDVTIDVQDASGLPALGTGTYVTPPGNACFTTQHQLNPALPPSMGCDAVVAYRSVRTDTGSSAIPIFDGAPQSLSTVNVSYYDDAHAINFTTAIHDLDVSQVRDVQVRMGETAVVQDFYRPSAPVSPVVTDGASPAPATLTPAALSRPLASVASTSSTRVSWKPPTSFGGTSLTGYVVTPPTGPAVSVAPGQNYVIVGGLAPTAGTFSVRSVNLVGPSTAVKAIPPDTTAPTVAAHKFAGTFTLGNPVFGWSASDAGTGLATFDVRYRRAGFSSAFGAWVYPAAWQGRGTQSLAVAIPPGYDYCLSVRARDKARNISGWSPSQCISKPLDDRSVTTSAGWSRTTGSAYFLSTATITRRLGATLSRTKAAVDRVGLVATTCATCGRVTIRVNGRSVGNLNLYSARSHNRVLLMLPRFSLRSGTVTVVVSTSGKLVAIDGLAVSRT